MHYIKDANLVETQTVYQVLKTKLVLFQPGSHFCSSGRDVGRLGLWSFCHESEMISFSKRLGLRNVNSTNVFVVSK